MSELKELKQTSMEFRRASSNMLRTVYNDENTYVVRFKQYIDDNHIVKDIIASKIANSNFDFRECFDTGNMSGWKEINIPTNENDHIKAMYDYLTDIVENEVSVNATSMSYLISSNKLNDMKQNFIEIAFLPLINFIIDSLSMRIMLLEEKPERTNFTQNIGTNYGTTNMAKENISSINNVKTQEISEICDIISKIQKILTNITIDEQVKDEIIDDLEIVNEQVVLEEPNKTRLKKAFNNIKSFLTGTKDAMVLGVELAAIAPVFIEKAGEFIQLLG